eukprot:1423437-Amphidinium_carterae.1
MHRPLIVQPPCRSPKLSNNCPRSHKSSTVHKSYGTKMRTRLWTHWLVFARFVFSKVLKSASFADQTALAIALRALLKLETKGDDVRTRELEEQALGSAAMDRHRMASGSIVRAWCTVSRCQKLRLQACGRRGAAAFLLLHAVRDLP